MKKLHVVASLMAAVALAACSKTEAPAPAPAPAPVAAPAPAPEPAPAPAPAAAPAADAASAATGAASAAAGSADSAAASASGAADAAAKAAQAAASRCKNSRGKSRQEAPRRFFMRGDSRSQPARCRCASAMTRSGASAWPAGGRRAGCDVSSGAGDHLCQAGLCTATAISPQLHGQVAPSRRHPPLQEAG